MKLENLRNFSDINPNINLIVFGLSPIDSKTIEGPMYTSARRAEYDIVLLYIHEHFCWVKSLSRLNAGQRKAHLNHQYFCNICLVGFGSETKLETHKKADCLGKQLTSIFMSFLKIFQIL